MRLRRLVPWLIVAIALFMAADHLAWVRRATGHPLSFADSGLHALWSVEAAVRHRSHPSPLGFAELRSSGYYPPFASWLALPVQLAEGIRPTAFRDAQAAFAFALSLGAGLFALRCWGPMLGLAAALLAPTWPGWWHQRAESMLDLPLAGMVALSLALLPDPRRPSAPLALLGGLVLGLALLTKQSMVFFAVPWLAWALGSGLLRQAWPRRWRLLGLAAVLGGPILGYLALQLRIGVPFVVVSTIVCAVAAWLVHRRGDGSLAAFHLRDGALLAAVTLAVAGRWYAVSFGIIEDVFRTLNRDHALPEGLDGLVWRLSWIPWLRSGFAFAPHSWLLPFGLLLALWQVRRQPLFQPLLLGLAAAFVGFASFPDPHERHFLPLIGPLTLLVLAPLGWIGERARPVAGALALVVCAYGLVFCLSWRDPTLGRGGQRMLSTDGRLGRELPTTDPDQLWRALPWVSGRWAFLAPLPPSGRWPVGEAVAAVLAAVPSGSQLVLFTSDDRVGADLLRAEAAARGAGRVQAFRRSGKGGKTTVPPGARACGVGVRIQGQVGVGLDGADGFAELAAFSATYPRVREPLELVASCAPTG